MLRKYCQLLLIKEGSGRSTSLNSRTTNTSPQCPNPVSLQAIALLSALAGAPSTANAQVSGYLFRGSGPPANSTSLNPPAGYPFPGGAPRQAPSPTSVGLPISPSQGTYTKDGFAALGACYCAPVSSRPSHCQMHHYGPTFGQGVIAKLVEL